MDEDLISFINFINSIDYDNTKTEHIIDKLLDSKYIYYDIHKYKKFYEKLFYQDKTDELNKLKYIIVLCLWSKHHENNKILYMSIEKYKNKMVDIDNLLNKINNLKI